MAFAGHSVATRFYKATRETVQPVQRLPDRQWTHKLLQAPGFYGRKGVTYDLTRAGLYRIFTHGMKSRNAIVYNGDPIAVLSAASWLNSFGNADRRRTGEAVSAFWERIESSAQYSKFSLLCGETIQFTRERLLSPLGIRSRTVRFITLGKPNRYVDGHVCVEVEIDGKWVLADVSLNTMFLGRAGLLNGRETHDAIRSGQWEYDKLALDGYSAERTRTGFDSTAYAEASLLTDDDVRAWHARIFQAIGIDEGGKTYWKVPDKSRAAWVRSLSSNWVILDPAEWDQRFYGM